MTTFVLRIPSGQGEPAEPLVQALVIAGLVVLLLLFVGFAAWRIRRTSPNRSRQLTGARKTLVP